jgi:hypothetical protein
MPQGFDNIINKFKSSTKQAADQMQRAAKVAKLKMDIISLNGERQKFLQTIGDRTFNLYKEASFIDGSVLIERIRNDFSQIERIDGRIKDMDNQIQELQAMGAGADIVDATDVMDVSAEEPDPNTPESNQQ